MELRVVKSDKDSCIKLTDILYCLCEWGSSEEEKVELIEKILCQPQFSKALKTVLEGYSDSEWISTDNPKNSADPLRHNLSEYGDIAARKLIQNLSDIISDLSNKLADSKAHTQKLLEQWPDGYKKYIPKEQLTYSYNYASEQFVQKLLEDMKVAP